MTFLIKYLPREICDGPTPCGASTVNGRSGPNSSIMVALGRSATLALVIGLMVTGSAAPAS